ARLAIPVSFRGPVRHLVLRFGTHAAAGCVIEWPELADGVGVEMTQSRRCCTLDAASTFAARAYIPRVSNCCARRQLATAEGRGRHLPVFPTRSPARQSPRAGWLTETGYTAGRSYRVWRMFI